MKYRGHSEVVRCLWRNHMYSKPNPDGTYSRNPGCPHCGYVGWRAEPLRLVSAAVPAVATRLAPPK
jgi:hypothetical protein